MIACLLGWSPDLMSVLLWVMMLVFLLMLWKLYRKGTDFTLLIVGDDGKLSWTKMLGCTGGIVFTWGFVYLVLHDRMTEWYYNGYGFICFGTAFAYKMQAGKFPPAQTVNVTAPADSNVNVMTSSPVVGGGQ